MKTITMEKYPFVGYRCVELTTAILPLVDVGMYESVLSPSNYEELQKSYFMEDYTCATEFLCVGNFDYNGYKSAVIDAAKEYIEDNVMPKLREYGVIGIEPMSIWSPKYYNYSTDELEFNLYLSDNFEQIMRDNIARMRNNRSLQRYIEEHFWSKSGFVSFMPRSFDEILAMDDEDRCISAYLTLALLESGYWSYSGQIIDESNFDLYDKVTCVYNGEFCNFYMYVSDEFLKLYDNDTALNELLWDVYFKIGRPWRNHNPKNHEYEGECKNEAVEFLLWATDMGYTLADLRAIAA